MARVSIREDWEFPNGLYIFKGEKQIDPQSTEGQQIQNIYQRQADTKVANYNQRIKWILTTYPKDIQKQKEFAETFNIKFEDIEKAKVQEKPKKN